MPTPTYSLHWLTWLAEPHFRGGVGESQLLAGAIILMLVLGYCFYTDIWCGMIIPNEVSVSLLVASLAAPPLLFAKPLYAYLGCLAMFAATLAASYAGWMGMGDAKILLALTLLMGRGALAVLVVASLLGLVYGIPARIYHQLTGRFRSHDDEGKRVLYEFPFGPAIALAVPFVFAIGGLSPVRAAALAALELATALFCWQFADRIKSWWAAIDEEARQLESDQPER